MSKTVAFVDVHRRIQEFGPRATLITVTDDGAPHVVSVVVGMAGETIEVRVGSRTRTNLGHRPRLTLVWNPVDDGEYQLLIDGTAADVGEPDERGVSRVTIAVDGGILHRLAELPGDGPSCITLDA